MGPGARGLVVLGLVIYLSSGNRGCARLGGEVALPLGVVKEELPSWSSSSVGIAAPLAPRCVRPWMMSPGAVEEETGPAAVRCVPLGLLDALPEHALGALGIAVIARLVI